MKLKDLTVQGFITEVASARPTPGGGSVAALCGAVGAALAEMVCGLTRAREEFEDQWQEMEEISPQVEELMQCFLSLVEEDSQAYRGVMSALRMPRDTEKQRARRRDSYQKALREATLVPLETLKASARLAELAGQVVKRGSPSAVTDAGAAVHLAAVAARVAAYNVEINLSSVKEPKFVLECKGQARSILQGVNVLVEDLDRYIKQRLG